MLLVAAAAIIAAPSPPATPGASGRASAQATAMVRVISGVRLSFGVDQGGEVPRARDSFVKSGDSQQPAKLIEFQ